MQKRISHPTIGFTLIELLIVLSVLAVLLSIVALAYGKLRQRLDLEGVTHKVVQDLQRCRSLAVSRSRFCRLRFSANRYDLQLSSSGSNWTTSQSFTLPNGISASWSAGDEIRFDPRGFANFPPNPVPYALSLAKGSNRLVIVPSMTGAMRVVRP